MMKKQIERIGRNGYYNYLGLRDFLLFTRDVLSTLFNFYSQVQIGFSVIVKQVYFTGYEAKWLIIFVALAIGGVLILQGNIYLTAFGQTRMIYLLLVTVVVRELSSLLTAMIVIARSGTSISTELGNMVVNKEIDLLRSFGISPLSYLVVSRTAGVIAAMFILTIVFNVTAVLGGWFFSTLFYPLNIEVFISNFMAEITVSDIILSVIKSIVYGFSIALISSYHGLKVVKASTEVPQRTIKAVVYSITTVVIANGIITFVYYWLK
jgi:phospholipid/cholesterol/gamma-HCH transport system permease protein